MSALIRAGRQADRLKPFLPTAWPSGVVTINAAVAGLPSGPPRGSVTLVGGYAAMRAAGASLTGSASGTVRSLPPWSARAKLPHSRPRGGPQDTPGQRHLDARATHK
jgi:hypothetical protein